ncbi:MAG: PIN domain-containing protein [Solirubrobacteraceae bacterium MAG38_C4-C5]|nr:PIN domain-containing protein [Candidatus Siliceabacter maunaloa]
MTLLDWGSDELLVDNSIYARRDDPIVEARWQEATEARQLILVAPMLMEVLYSAKNGSAAQRELEDLEAAYEIELIDDAVWDLAIQTQVELAKVGNGYQRRFSVTDLLTAALAHQRDYGVLHYDADFDQIQRDSGLQFRSVWAAQPPSLDSPLEPDADAKALRKSLRLLLGTLDDTDDADLLSQLFESLRGQVQEAGLSASPACLLVSRSRATDSPAPPRWWTIR